MTKATAALRLRTMMWKDGDITIKRPTKKFNPNHDELGRFASSDSGGPYGDEHVYGGKDVTGDIVDHLQPNGDMGGCSGSAGCPGATDAVMAAVGYDGIKEPTDAQDTEFRMAEKIGTDWAQSPSGTPGGAALYEAAAQMKGLPIPSYITENEDLVPPSDDQIAVAKDILVGNQQLLAKEFPDPNATVTLYRGTGIPPEQINGSVDLNALSSWSTDQSIAREFGPTLLTATVPVSRIAGVPRYGLGVGGEHEVVLWGGKLDCTAEEMEAPEDAGEASWAGTGPIAEDD